VEFIMALIQSVQYRVVHDTTYDYSCTVSNGHHFTHMSPRSTPAQQVLSHELICEPLPSEVQQITDYFGNDTRSFHITAPHDSLLVSARTTVAVSPQSYPEELLQQDWALALSSDLQAWEDAGIAEMRLPSQHVECLNQSEAYARRFFTPGRPWMDAMLDLTRHIHQEFVYDPHATTIYTPISEVFASRHGVCQDFAHLMLSCLRSMKLSARYVSGYLLNEPPPGVTKLLGSDASHAWVESWLPGIGWIGFDPTNGKLANEEFITVAWGRDFMDVTPLRGVVLGGGSHDMQVYVSVTRIDNPAQELL
jgi:transglutaminase-like putative cysteine protease